MGYDIEKEKREAIEAGQRALSSLRTAKENLNSAKNWGLVDMFEDIRGVAFDLDGTLVDSAPGLAAEHGL